jgi:hypothetical protein
VSKAPGGQAMSPLFGYLSAGGETVAWQVAGRGSLPVVKSSYRLDVRPDYLLGLQSTATLHWEMSSVSGSDARPDGRSSIAVTLAGLLSPWSHTPGDGIAFERADQAAAAPEPCTVRVRSGPPPPARRRAGSRQWCLTVTVVLVEAGG